MPTINFPDPNTTTTYTFNGRTWNWNGKAWVIVSADLSTTSVYVYDVNGITGSVGISAGTNITINKSGKTLTINSTASGSGTPGGLDQQIQYNSSGSFAGSTGLKFDPTNFILTVGDNDSEILPAIKFGQENGQLNKYIEHSVIDGSLSIYSGEDNSGTRLISFDQNTIAAHVPFSTGLTLQGNLNFPNFSGICGASYISFKNGESIRNSTNGSIDIMPLPATSGGSTFYGIRLNMTAYGTGVGLGLINANTGTVNQGDTAGINHFVFQRPIRTLNDIDTIFGSNSWSKLRHYTTIQSGVCAGYTGLASFNIGVLSNTSQSSGAVAIMNSSHFDSPKRVIGTQHADPNLYIFSGDNGETLDFIRFEHDRTDANIIVGQGNLNINATSVNIPNLNIVDGGVY